MVCVLVCGGAGCVYNGPRATTSEVREYEPILMKKAIEYRLDLLSRLSCVGYRILSFLPKQVSQRVYPYLGVVVVEVSKDAPEIVGLPKGNYLVIGGTVGGTSCEAVDIRRWDVLLAIEGISVRSLDGLRKVLMQFDAGDFVELKLWRSGQIISRVVRLDKRRMPIDFYMSSDAQINAMATPSSVIVTYGMMKFVKSDDELAVVLGHEIAHIILSHHKKVSTVDVISSMLGSILGAKLDEVLPGIGRVVVGMGVGAVESGISRDFERQADYWGLYLAYRAGYDIDVGKDIWERFAVEVPESMISDFWKTHPSSIERFVYIKKITEEIKEGHFPTLPD